MVPYMVPLDMSRINKLVAKMRINPRDWRIGKLKIVADTLNITYDQHGTSHVIFKTKAGKRLSVPAHKPIKPIYIKEFLNFIDGLEGDNE